MTVAAIVNPRFTAWDTDGSVLSSGKLYTYEAGSTTDEKTTYSDPDLTNVNANPVILDSKGQADVYYEGTARLRLFTEDDVLVFDRDKIATVGDTNVEWVSSLTPTFASSTTFTLSGDQTDTYHPGRRIRCTDSSTLYGYIQASSFSDPNTTVTVSLDSGSLTASLSAVAVGLLVADNFSVPSTPSVPNTHNEDHTLVRSDAGKTLIKTAADTATRTWTIPLNSSVSFPAGAWVRAVNLDDNDLTVTADSTATLRLMNGAAPSDGDITLSQGETLIVYQDATDTWLGWKAGATNADYISSGTLDPARLKQATGTFSTGSLTSGSSTSENVSHGLGTDNIFMHLQCIGDAGSGNQYKWEATAVNPAGESARFLGQGSTSYNLGVNQLATTGNATFNVRNNGPGSQTLTCRYLIIALD